MDKEDNRKVDSRGIPIIPKLPVDRPTLPNQPVAVCGECGRDIYQVEGYYCTNLRCPVQLKITC
jgi:hypothetical protein